jgi:ankyrin repeat protein
MEGNSVALERLLSVSQKSINAVTEHGDAPLHLASNERVAQLLLKNGADATQRNKSKYTPLYEALYGIIYSHEPYFDVARCLLQHGAAINQKIRYGETVLHPATHKSINYTHAQFLLSNDADADEADSLGVTPFDRIIAQNGQWKIFQQFGYSYYHTDAAEDPFELFKKDPYVFFEKDTICDFVRDLYFTAQRQEKKRKSSRNRSDAIIIKIGNGSKMYIFKKATFADLEACFGEHAVTYMRSYLEDLFVRAQRAISERGEALIKVPGKYDINGIDECGNSLLHIAVEYERIDQIRWLIENGIDCTIQNNENQLAFDCLTKSNFFCIAAFIDTLAKKFFEGSLDHKTEQFVLNRLFFWDRLPDQSRMNYFLKAVFDRPDICSFFFEKGMRVNYKNKKGISPLFCAIQPWLKKSWGEVPSINKYNIRVLLADGAVVEKKMLQVSQGYLKKLLQKMYKKQSCCMCFEHPDDLSDIPCNKKHTQLLCKECCECINNACPLCKYC